MPIYSHFFFAISYILIRALLFTFAPFSTVIVHFILNIHFPISSSALRRPLTPFWLSEEHSMNWKRRGVWREGQIDMRALRISDFLFLYFFPIVFDVSHDCL